VNRAIIQEHFILEEGTKQFMTVLEHVASSLIHEAVGPCIKDNVTL
jgi:hypothetical protein